MSENYISEGSEYPKDIQDRIDRLKAASQKIETIFYDEIAPTATVFNDEYTEQSHTDLYKDTYAFQDSWWYGTRKDNILSSCEDIMTNFKAYRENVIKLKTDIDYQAESSIPGSGGGGAR